jgi:hypothetical protein
MRSNKRLAAALCVWLAAAALWAAPDTAVAPGDAPADASLFIGALEKLVAGDIAPAVADLDALVERYPDSAYTPRARELAAEYRSRQNIGGIVPFYLGSIAASLSLVTGAQNALLISDPVAYGASGLIGVGAGLGLSYLATAAAPMPGGREIFIENATFIPGWIAGALTLGVLGPYIPDQYKQLLISGASTAGRIGGYFASDGWSPEAGRYALSLTTFGWSAFYVFLAVNVIMEIQDPNVASIGQATVPAGLALLSGRLWDRLSWRADRVGLVTVGGLAGLLGGVFTNMIISGFLPEAPFALPGAVMLATSLAGQAVAVWATAGWPAESGAPAALAGFSLTPTVAADGWGLLAKVRY